MKTPYSNFMFWLSVFLIPGALLYLIYEWARAQETSVLAQVAFAVFFVSTAFAALYGMADEETANELAEGDRLVSNLCFCPACGWHHVPETGEQFEALPTIAAGAKIPSETCPRCNTTAGRWANAVRESGYNPRDYFKTISRDNLERPAGVELAAGPDLPRPGAGDTARRSDRIPQTQPARSMSNGLAMERNPARRLSRPAGCFGNNPA